MQEAKHCAVIVGVNAAEHGSLKRLHLAVVDAKAIAEAIIAAGLGPVHLLGEDTSGGDGVLVITHDNCRSNFLESLAVAVASCGELGSLFLFFAGHSIEESDLPTLLCRNIPPPNQPYTVSPADVADSLKGSSLANLIVVLDTCGPGRNWADKLIEELEKTRTQVIILTSGRPNTARDGLLCRALGRPTFFSGVLARVIARATEERQFDWDSMFRYVQYIARAEKRYNYNPVIHYLRVSQTSVNYGSPAAQDMMRKLRNQNTFLATLLTVISIWFGSWWFVPSFRRGQLPAVVEGPRVVTRWQDLAERDMDDEDLLALRKYHLIEGRISDPNGGTTFYPRKNGMTDPDALVHRSEVALGMFRALLECKPQHPSRQLDPGFASQYRDIPPDHRLFEHLRELVRCGFYHPHENEDEFRPNGCVTYSEYYERWLEPMLTAKLPTEPGLTCKARLQAIRTNTGRSLFRTRQDQAPLDGDLVTRLDFAVSLARAVRIANGE